jgi:hopanoid biosynthesis associated protein HpnK
LARAIADADRPRIILNADDFGRSAGINAGVIRAHRDGVLTSASLMVTGEAAGEAIALARRTPTLAVGLHLVLAGGRPALPAREIPRLVGPAGLLPANPVWAGLGYSLGRAARTELARELEAQFDLFAAAGLPLAHVDGHMHLHLHPVAFDLILALARERGARLLRIPRDDLGLSIRHSRRLAASKIVWTLVFGLLRRSAAGKLRALDRITAGPVAAGRPATRPVAADRVYGLLESGHMTEAYVLRVLKTLARRRPRLAELYFHPDVGPRLEALGPNPDDLACLVSPAVREAISDLGLLPRNGLTFEA